MAFEELPYLAVFDIVDNKMLSMIDLNKTGDFNKKQESIMNFQSLFNTSHKIQVESLVKIIRANQVLLIIKL
jgi:hypothetical protein